MESGIKVSEQEAEINFDLDALRKVTEKELKKAQEILEFVTKYKFDGPCEIQLSYKSALDSSVVLDAGKSYLLIEELRQYAREAIRSKEAVLKMIRRKDEN